MVPLSQQHRITQDAPQLVDILTRNGLPLAADQVPLAYLKERLEFSPIAKIGRVFLFQFRKSSYILRLRTFFMRSYFV